MNLTNWMAALRRSVAIGTGALTLALSTTVMAAAPDEFSIGSVPSDISSIVPQFALASGAFTKYGINAHLVTIEGGSRGMQVLLSGKIQGMQGGLSIIVEANREGADLRMVSSSANSSLFDIYVTPNIKAPADLKGKKFAISSFTAETDMAATLALRHWNLTRKDVTVVALGGAAQRIAAQLSGQVAASAYPNPSSEIAREKGLVKLLDLGNDGAPWVFNGIVFQHDFLTANPDLVTRVIKANIEGEYKALSDENWAKKIIADAYKTDSKAIVDAAYDQWKRTVARDFALSPVAVKNVIAEVNAMGPALSSMDPSNYVDTHFTDALKKDGFVAQVKKQYGM
jgi:ABC-type nitrate/sulfonate/bicarbonate transport system substrate-binding protein